MVTCQLSSLVTHSSVTINALVLRKISGNIPRDRVNVGDWSHLSGLKLADPKYNEPGPIDILVGADTFSEITMDGKLIGSSGSPVAQNSIFGWILGGRLAPSPQQTTSFISSFVASLDLNESLRRFWEIEELPISTSSLTAEEKQCEEFFRSTHYRDDTGRYVVRLPFSGKSSPLTDPLALAVNTQHRVERKLKTQPVLKQQYVEFMHEYLALGHMEPVPANELRSPSYYLPHHAVMKEDSTTTKLRVVFDGSAKSSGASINDLLMVGPKLQQDIFSIILRFRLHNVCFTADIAKMYRQILINPLDYDSQRIVWRESPDLPMQHFRLKTVTYGTSCAPYLALKTLHQLASDEKVNFPEASSLLIRDSYIDDLMSGSTDVQSALTLQAQLCQLVRSGGFDLRKWSSNSKELLNAIPESHRELSPQQLDFDGSVKTLGIVWHPSSDHFSFTVKSSVPSSPTKRKILSEIARLFDPLGWLAPVVIRAKILMQQLWSLGVSWDEELSGDMAEEWTKYIDNLPRLEQLQIPRKVLGSTHPSTVELHGFSDSSEKAYSACIYTRCIDYLGNICVNLICSKTKVAPIKQISLPRLELCGALLLARLMVSTKQSLSVITNSQNVFAWTDSTIVLHWLVGQPNRWKTFVANRVAEIQTLLPVHHWHHVPSEHNPADCASRGIPPEELGSHPLWWHGPVWLSSDSSVWPQRSLYSSSTTSNEERKILAHLAIKSSVDMTLLDTFSSLTKLQRVTAYIFRFLANCKPLTQNKLLGFLSTSELQNALHFWIKLVQSESFSEECSSLASGNALPPRSKLIGLQPFLDKNGLLRVGGRLQQSTLSYEKKHPLLLPRSHSLTNMIIQHEHLKNLHACPQALQASLQQRYWIIGARNAIRRIIHSCIPCFRARPGKEQQLMESLPLERI